MELKVYRSDETARSTCSTGNPHYDIFYSGDKFDARHLINLTQSGDPDRAEAAIDALTARLFSQRLTVSELHYLRSVLSGGLRCSDGSVRDAWDRLKGAFEIPSVQWNTAFLPKVPDSRLCVYNAERFERTGTADSPVFIPGRLDDRAVFALSGLHASGYPLLNQMHRLVNISGCGAQINALANHVLNWESLRRCSPENWIRGAIDAATELRHSLQLKKCVGVGFSTGAMTLVAAAARCPDLFDSLVLICLPLEISSFQKRIRLAAASTASTFFGGALHFIGDYTAAHVPLPRAAASKPERKNPGPKRSPLEPYGSFYRMVDLSRKELVRLRVPTAIISGSEDKIAPFHVIDELLERNGLGNCKHHVLDGGKHMLPLTAQGDKIPEIVMLHMRASGII